MTIGKVTKLKKAETKQNKKQTKKYDKKYTLRNEVNLILQKEKSYKIKMLFS